ncbi:hypothetical protein CCHR01_15362 [Colletotrichum chrysophilum]|uniref:Uncharacterized protein n=1 Tax=Colletotrichum chrysophilum TaxID=1836956 RepID=A0AAD9EB31_9PEZI|nr:hypothetical protein CCHR01_15362 [Colletotrichum chrysophilum]
MMATRARGRIDTATVMTAEVVVAVAAAGVVDVVDEVVVGATAMTLLPETTGNLRRTGPVTRSLLRRRRRRPLSTRRSSPLFLERARLERPRHLCCHLSADGTMRWRLWMRR